MKNHKDQFPIEKMCNAFKVSKSGYYHWRNRIPSKLAKENKVILFMIRDIYNTSKGRYGSPKITQELRKKQVHISRPRVARLMRKEGLKSIINKKYKVCTTDSKHNNRECKINSV